MKTVFHVGYRKCASTFLQSVVFSRHPDLQMLERNELPRYVALTPEADYDADYVSKIISEKKKLRVNNGMGSIVFSEERMLTVPGIDCGLIAKRVFDIDNNGIVIIVIRNQTAFLLSNHSQCLATGKTQIYSFSEWVDSIRCSGDRNTYLDKADFHDQVRAFDALFGASRVGVFLLEDMRSDPESFSRRLGGFIGLDLSGPEYALGQHDYFDERTGKTPKMTRSSRWSLLAKSNPAIRALDELLRPVTPTIVRRAVGRVTGLASPHNRSADPETRRWIVERYREGNRKLAERLDRDLGPLGYPL